MGINEEELEEVELDIITLPGEDGKEIEYAVVGQFSLETADYVALCRVLEDAFLDEENVLFYRYVEEDGDNVTLEDIEDEEELTMVEDTFEDLCSEDDEE